MRILISHAGARDRDERAHEIEALRGRVAHTGARQARVADLDRLRARTFRRSAPHSSSEQELV